MKSLELILAEVLPFPAGPDREKLVANLAHYAELLKKWNNVYNLTAITKTEEIAYKHFLDSLLILPYLTGENVLDVGTGAGIPGIPLALASPQKQFTLLDSNSKKTRFLKQVVTELKLPNVKVEHFRIEEYAPENKFDIVLTRAFAELKVITEKTAHVLAPQGEIVAMKGKLDQQELAMLSDAFEIIEIVRIDTKTKYADQLGERHVIRITNK